MLKVAVVMVPFLVMGLAGCSKENEAGKPQKLTSAPPAQLSRKFNVVVAPVKRERVVYEIDAVGSLVEENRFEIPARLEGVAQNVTFSEGDVVTSGQELCRIDYDRYLLQLQEAESGVQEKRAAVASAEANLQDLQRETSTSVENARVALELAEGEYRRRAVAATSAFTSSEEQAQYEARFKLAQTTYRDAVGAVKTKIVKAETDLQSARAALTTAQSQLALAQDDLERSIVKAPVDGAIQQRAIVNGQYLSKGDMVALMVQSDPLRLKFTVPEGKASRLQTNMELKFTVPAWPEKVFSAIVYDIGAFADTNTREVVCWARVEGDQTALLKPGYFTKVRLQTESKEEAIVVPLISVQPTEKGMVAYVVKDGSAQRRSLQIGMYVTGDAVEVLSGLDEGELLVVEGGNALRDGAAVEIKENKPRMPIIPESDALKTSGSATALTGTETLPAS